VNDQGNEHTGSFLGWSLSLWGSAIDGSQAKQFVVPKLDAVFPPMHPDEADTHPAASSSIADAATSTRTKPKPTAALPSDHGSAEGEADRPAFSSAPAASASSASASATPSAMEPTADEGWFADMDTLASNKRWFGGAAALVLLFLVGAGAFFWRRRRAVARRRAQYASLGAGGAGDELPMRARGGTKELYDAFGTVSDDDDDDADEETGLRAGGSRRPGGPLGAHAVGYHSGFLDDEEPVSPSGGYRDEPADGEDGLRPHHGDRGASGSGTESTSEGSWEHASQTR
jgi:kexin